MELDTKYQRAKIIVEQLKSFYVQIFFSLGLFLIIVIRFNFYKPSTNFAMSTAISGALTNETMLILSNMNSQSLDAISTMSPQDLSFFNNPWFLILYVACIFSLFVIFKFIKFYRTKNKFIRSEKFNENLKKHMKMDEIPTVDEVHEKLNQDKSKEKKKFYYGILRIAVVIAILFLMKYYFSQSMLLDVVIFFAIFNMIYRYLFIFHLDKKLFKKKWEDRKIDEYMKQMA
ncbi:2TM domain-containing protein [Methanobrevibacter curvatus]|nr:2TM domain-containing protein [Methanobrevibacter curvatus]